MLFEIQTKINVWLIAHFDTKSSPPSPCVFLQVCFNERTSEPVKVTKEPFSGGIHGEICARTGSRVFVFCGRDGEEYLASENHCDQEGCGSGRNPVSPFLSADHIDA